MEVGSSDMAIDPPGDAIAQDPMKVDPDVLASQVDTAVKPGPSANVPRSGPAAYQWYFAPTDMADTPSVQQSGVTVEQERYSRWKGIQLIFRIGDYMRLGNHVTCTASVFFHRFFMRKAMPKDAGSRTFDTFPFHEMAPTCIFLACKVEETHRKLHAIIEATMAMLDRTPIGIQRAEAHMYRADTSSRDYIRWKDVVLLNEEKLLESLCFDLIIDQPHPIAIKGAVRLGASRDMVQLTVILVNVMLYGAVCLFYDSATLAACAFRRACQMTNKDPQAYLHNTRHAQHPWSLAFDVEPDEMEDALKAVDDYLAYHQERLGSAMPTQSGGHVAGPSSQQTPNGKRSFDTPLQPNGLAQSRPSDDDGDQKMDIATDAPSSMPADTAELAPSTVEKPLGRDVVRPISRHGSRAGTLGPPPPLSTVSEAKAEPAQPYVAVSPTIHTSAAEESGPDPHVEAAAQKLAHEQGQSEKAEGEAGPLQVGQGPGDTAAPTARAAGKEDSEEEGAL